MNNLTDQKAGPVRLVIPGEPVAKGRPRLTKHGHVYTPDKTVSYENLVRLSYMQSYPYANLMEGQLQAIIKAFMKIPKSATKHNQEGMEKNSIRPTKRPDCDNIAKAVLDALNGLAYRDDSQIVVCTIGKYYSDIPRVEVDIRPLGAEEAAP